MTTAEIPGKDMCRRQGRKAFKEEAMSEELKLIANVVCPHCDGKGWYEITVSGHAHGCDGTCKNCPVPEQGQVQCGACEGTGMVRAPEAKAEGLTCEWKQATNVNNEPVNSYHTACGRRFTNAIPYEFCQFCGRRIALQGGGKTGR